MRRPLARLRFLLPLLTSVSMLASTSARAGDRVFGEPTVTRSEVIAKHGMVATAQPLASLAALDILRQGGSAVDAAIAANAVLGLVEPVGCGIGGDLFAIVWDPETRQLYGLNGSGRSPRGLTLDGLKAALHEQGVSEIPAHGPLPVSVPGAVDGWFELHARFGVLPMRDVLAPAIALARDGFPVTEVIAEYWRLNAKNLEKFENFRSTFMPGGRAPRKGETFTNPDLAATYETLARDGRDAFYRGELATTIATTVQRLGGFLSEEDLAAHTSTWVKPVRASYRGYDVWELPPNGQGIAALQMLELLEGFDLRAMGFGSAEYLHALVEAKKLAFADRARFYVDPEFSSTPMDPLVRRLISEAYAAERREEIGPRAAPAVDAGTPTLNEGDTTYLATADHDGMMVSLIQSNYRGMGSGVVPDGLGFGLQDRGQLFALDADHANAYAPGKRPFHTIIPAFVSKDGEPWLAFGVMGGAAQPQMHAQVLINLIDFDMNLQQAGDAARMLHLGSSQPTGEVMNDGGAVYLESGIMGAAKQLKRKGHRIERRRGGFGGYQAVMWDGVRKVWVGASESRKDGAALGY
jgi:gamma-glutamyltranspeptidase/glutathione hydrolase